MSTYKNLISLGAAIVFALGLAACGGGSDGPPTDPPPPPPTAYESALDKIAKADTAEAAQAAYDEVKDDVTAAEGDKLQTAVNNRITAIRTAARVAEQKKALTTAAGAIDTSDLSTQDAVDAARAAIVGLRGALMAAADVSDADKAMYQTQLDDAVKAVDAAQGGIDTATRRSNQMTALSGASDTLQAALAALADGDPTQAKVDAANTALAGLNSAITDASDLTDDEKATYVREAGNAAAPIQTAQTAVNNADDKADDAAKKAMAAKAMKLYDGISARTTSGNVRNAAYSGTNPTDGEITVTMGDTVQALKADEAEVADHHNWKGMKYTASGTGVAGTYEAIVYSNVGEAQQGAKFSATYTYNHDGTASNPDGSTKTELEITGNTAVATRITSSRFDQSAGKKEFELGTNLQRVVLSGSYHGVSGTYYCRPASDAKCAATVDTGGFTLSGGTWTFMAKNKDTRLMDTADANYESYGWWIHTAADGDLTASAFTDNKGTDRVSLSIGNLRGTATYEGGAAGQYALRSSTGGTNDAGSFMADVELDATFAATGHTISGTIDNFMGDDGKARDWSVKLNKTDITSDGSIDGVGGDQNNVEVGTVWTIGEDAAAKSGQWRGSLQEIDPDDDVPMVATGTFYTEYGEAGRMVGGFGANKQ